MTENIKFPQTTYTDGKYCSRDVCASRPVVILHQLHWKMEDKFVWPMSVQNVISYNFPDDMLCNFQSQIVMWQQIRFCGFKREPSWLAAVGVCGIKVDYCMQI